MPSSIATPAPFRIEGSAETATIPLLIDSPHGGTRFPDGFETLASREECLTAWDAHVGDLWRGAVSAGGVLIEAEFARVVIDPNRAADDIDPALVEGEWPPEWGTLNPTRYSARGMGLIRRNILPGRPMYAAPLPPADIRQFIDQFYTPYHTMIATGLDTLRQRFGRVWHIDAHSMKSQANAMNIDLGQARPDFVLGDLDGTSCEPDFTALVERELLGSGYSVARNQPYKGGDIVRRYGRPGAGVHSLQIEINRALYLDEERFEKSYNYNKLQNNLARLCTTIAAHLAPGNAP